MRLRHPTGADGQQTISFVPQLVQIFGFIRRVQPICELGVIFPTGSNHPHQIVVVAAEEMPIQWSILLSNNSSRYS